MSKNTISVLAEVIKRYHGQIYATGIELSLCMDTAEGILEELTDIAMMLNDDDVWILARMIREDLIVAKMLIIPASRPHDA